MKAFIYNTKKVEEFDNNRHVTVKVDPVKKKVTVFLNCELDEAFEKFNKTVRALGTKFRGYYIVSTIGATSDGKLLTLDARIH